MYYPNYGRPRRFRRGFRSTRRRAKWLWVRETISDVSASAIHNYDLLTQYKADMGITLNLPDIRIWRIILKISIRFHLSPATITASDGFLLSLFVDDSQVFPTNTLLSPYGEMYQTWDQIYMASLWQQGQVLSVATNNFMLYREYDVRTHRKLRDFKDTQIMQLVSTGNTVTDEISFTESILLRLPT